MSAPASQRVPSLAEWLRLLYGDILFPGRETGADGRTIPARWLILSILGLSVCLAGLNMPFLEPDETRYAQIPREMLASVGMIVPLLDGEPYYDKPPLFYWAVASSYQLLGESIPAARLVPALAVFATLLLTYAIGRASLGEGIAWRGAILLALAPGLVGMGRLLLLDGLLTLVVFAGQSTLWLAAGRDRFHLGWWVTATCLAGVGLMTKGPIALLLMALPLLAHRWLVPAPLGNAPTWKAWLALGIGAGLVALPWHVSLAWKDPQFLRHYLWEHHILRFLQPFDHVRGTFFYLPVLALGLLPGSFLLVPLLKNLSATGDDARARRSAALGYWTMCAGACIGFFSLSGCKLPTYVLPAFPACALVLGYAAQEIPTGWWKV
ncbi:MAG: ArnT family glycosyltransferase, partial [Gemmataceae bacterium]